MSTNHSHSQGSREVGSGRGRTVRYLTNGIVVVAILVVGVGIATIATIATKGNLGRAVASPTSVANALPTADTHQPLTVVSSIPANGATGIPSDASISLQFSSPLDPNSPQPILTPAVAGIWQLLTPTTFAFVATTPFVPTSTETVTIPGAIASTSGKTLDRKSTRLDSS